MAIGYFLCRFKSGTICQVMSFLVKTNFCASGHAQLFQFCHVIQVTCRLCYSLLNLFFSFHLSFLSSLSTQKFVSAMTGSNFLAISSIYVVIATDAMPNCWHFYFQGSGLPLSFSGTWSDYMCRVHIALRQLH